MEGSIISEASPTLRMPQCSHPDTEKSYPLRRAALAGSRAVHRHGAQGSWAQSTGKSPAGLLGIYSWRFLGNLPGSCLGITVFSIDTVGKKQSSVGETKANPWGDPERENSGTLHPSSLQQRWFKAYSVLQMEKQWIYFSMVGFLNNPFNFYECAFPMKSLR